MDNIEEETAEWTLESARSLVLKLFGRKSRKIKQLVGHTDKNYYVESDDGKKYVFKIANPFENTFDDLKAQTDLFVHLQGYSFPEYRFPEVFKSVNQNLIEKVKGVDGRIWFARLLSFIEGGIMADLKSHEVSLLESVGTMMSMIDKCFSEVKSVSSSLLERNLEWDLRHVLVLEEYVDCVQDHELRNRVLYVLKRMRNFVVPKMFELRRQVIHGDGNMHNTIVDEKGVRANGLIDFGDVVYSYLVFDVAVAASYITHFKDDPLKDALLFVKSYHRTFPLLEEEVDCIFDCICSRLCQSIVLNLKQREKDQDNEYLMVSVGPAIGALFKLCDIHPLAARNMFREACGMKFLDVKGEYDVDGLLSRRESVLGKNLSISYQKPINIVRGFLQYLYDENGKRYLDTVNNICHVGHCHPLVVSSLCEQTRSLNTNTRYLHDDIVKYAEELLSTFPKKLCVVYFVCTGSESMELALRMARTKTKSKETIVLDHAYHGNTNSLIEISPYKFNGKGGGMKSPYVNVCDLPDCFRGKFKYDDPKAGMKYAKKIFKIVESLKTEGKGSPTFIHESFPGVAGQIPLPKGFLVDCYQSIRKVGGVCIADEVQIGFGRVGNCMWEFANHGVVPDIVALGKPMGNGHPLAAVVTTREIAESFNNGMEYFNSFGGNPVSCRVGREVLKVIKKDGLMNNALEIGKILEEGLNELKKTCPLIGDIRGKGLFWGVELVKDRSNLAPAVEEAKEISEKMKDAGILVSVDGYLHNVIKFKSPMVINKKDAEFYVNTLGSILSNM